ncbi:hypothetical protein UAJ10_25675 [Nitrospirillum sp. BR 11164]|uniref:hypothetical protein n=1 Tax=Nitrospirillum sp. BR 11164 TaxID=3104324 RepID=UPI002AFFFE04|nr:hypothetical protein [Nitrospirillum sp. BR 11164]MEA1652386.1 hypothetical protein [Nitrospirillum sp. BR 11164]
MQSVLPAWRQVLLFQSPRQLASYAAGTLAAMAAGVFPFIGLPWLMGHGAIPPDILAGTVAFAIAVSLRIPYEVQPVRWRVSSACPGLVADRAAVLLASIDYLPAERANGRTLYRLAPAPSLSWSRWRECKVEVRVQDADVTIIGARIAVRHLHRALRRA